MATNISLLNSNNQNNINANFERVATALANTVGRDGTTPNQMNADLDLNNNDLLNVGLLDADDVTIDGQPVTGILNAAVAAAAAAAVSEDNAAASEVSAAASAATALALVSSVSISFATRAAAIAYTPLISPDFIRIEGYTTAGDGGGALYKKVGSEPSHAGKFSIALLGSGTVVWYELSELAPELRMFGGINDGTTANDTAFTNLRAYAVAKGYPAFIRGQGFKLTQEHSLASNLWLIGTKGGFITTDNTLRSVLYVAANDVKISGDILIQMPVAIAGGNVGIGLFVSNCSRARISGVETLYGKFGIAYHDVNDIVIEDCTTRSSSRYGFWGGGVRTGIHNRCKVYTTTDSTANDCFKLTGAQSGTNLNSTYNVWYNDCYGEGAGAGQVLDCIMITDALNDLYNVYINNLTGKNCLNGLLEIKSGGALVTHYMHSIFVNGGSYSGSGTEPYGIYMSDRVDNVQINGTVITDVIKGLQVDGTLRRCKIVDLEIRRPRQEGIDWSSSGISNQLIRPVIMDANFGQASSLYAAIKLNNITPSVINDLVIDSPTIMKSNAYTGNAHTYGISFESGTGRIRMTGVPVISGSATAPINYLAGTVHWPEKMVTPAIDLALSASASSQIYDEHSGNFVVCAVSYTYTAGSNVQRTVTTQGRGTAGTTTVLAQDSSLTAALAQRDYYQLAAPVSLGVSRPALQIALSSVVLPGSPTGKIIVGVHGYYDGALAA